MRFSKCQCQVCGSCYQSKQTHFKHLVSYSLIFYYDSYLISQSHYYLSRLIMDYAQANTECFNLELIKCVLIININQMKRYNLNILTYIYLQTFKYKFLNNFFSMPKVVDNYVFQRKIGSGQYGDVFKGYNKITGQDIAIKAIKRQNIKGKFMQLLQNEIKVLKTCDNRNIIKLYDIKKTANNFYLIIEYCNEGDLSAYLKKKKTINEEQAIEFFVQIVNAFKTLVKNKIMHRDFKLANILMHDGEIKIADFGFSKLLTNEQFTQTMLGSPLNMAPEVLGGTQYNSKADIWSIGVVFYEMLFGTPPYKASNMVDLINNIKNKPVTFPKNINKISQVTQDAIKRMLIVDPKKRIQWQNLFCHPINTYLQDQIKKDMDQALNNNQDDIALNASKFYLKANMVVDHPKEIQKKQNVNNYTYEVMNKKTKQQFNGNLIKRQNQRKKSVEMKNQVQRTTQAQSQKDIINDEQTQRQKQIKSFKRNSAYLLHRRNIYVFLAAVAEQSMNIAKQSKDGRLGDPVGYLLVRKLLNMLETLKMAMDNKKDFPNLVYWQQFTREKDYKDIRIYVQKQYDVFKVFYDSVHTRVKDKVKELDPETQQVLQNKRSPNNQKIFQRLIRDYIKILQIIQQNKAFKSEQDQRNFYFHLSKIIDCLNVEEVFQFQRNGNVFNFHSYYQQPKRIDLEVYKKQVIKKLSFI